MAEINWTLEAEQWVQDSFRNAKLRYGTPILLLNELNNGWAEYISLVEPSTTNYVNKRVQRITRINELNNGWAKFNSLVGPSTTNYVDKRVQRITRINELNNGWAEFNSLVGPSKYN